MNFRKNADALQHSTEILTAAGAGEMQTIGRKDQPALIVLNFDQLFEPDRSKWVPIQLKIPNSEYNFLVNLAEESDLMLDDLIVLIIFEFLVTRKLEALKRSLNSTDASNQET